MRYSLFACLGAFLLFGTVLQGCSDNYTPPLRLGTNVWPGYEPLYLARRLEQWPEARIRLVEYPSATEVMRAFRNRSLEAASLTLDEVLILHEDKIPVKVILVHDVSHGGDVILARPPIATIKDLHGKSVAVESNALGAFVITRALEINGMGLNDIHIKSFDVDMHERVYEQGLVDAVVTFEPVRTKLLADGAREIFSSREMPNEIVDVLVVHEDYLQKHPGVIKELVQGWFEAVDFLQTDMDSAAHLIAERLKVTPAEAIASYKGLRIPTRDENHSLLAGENAGLLDTLEKLNRILVTNKIIRQPVSLKNILSAQAIAAQ